MIHRSEIYWADLGSVSGSRPAKRRPVLVVQSEPYNASRLAMVLAVVITSNTALAAMPGNVFLPSAATGLPRDSVVNVTALVGPASYRRISCMTWIVGYVACWACEGWRATPRRRLCDDGVEPAFKAQFLTESRPGCNLDQACADAAVDLDDEPEAQ